MGSEQPSSAGKGPTPQRPPSVRSGPEPAAALGPWANLQGFRVSQSSKSAGLGRAFWCLGRGLKPRVWAAPSGSTGTAEPSCACASGSQQSRQRPRQEGGEEAPRTQRPRRRAPCTPILGWGSKDVPK